MEVPPLLKRVMARNRAAKDEVTRESDLLLPAYKIYEGDVRFDEKLEPHILSRFISDEFATFKGKIKESVALFCCLKAAVCLAGWIYELFYFNLLVNRMIKGLSI